jgi:hypothetical protein
MTPRYVTLNLGGGEKTSFIPVNVVTFINLVKYLLNSKVFQTFLIDDKIIICSVHIVCTVKHF